MEAKTFGSQSYSQNRRRNNPPTGCLSAQKRGASTTYLPLALRSQTPSLLATADLPKPLCGAPTRFSKWEAARAVRLRRWARDSPKDSAVCTHSPGPVLALAVQPSPLQGLPRFPPWPQGAALTPQQEEEAERCGWPHAGRRDPRAAGGTLCLERGHRVASRRGGAAALRRAGAGAPISPAPEAGSRAASSQGLGQRRPRGGRG